MLLLLMKTDFFAISYLLQVGHVLQQSINLLRVCPTGTLRPRCYLDVLHELITNFYVSR